MIGSVIAVIHTIRIRGFKRLGEEVLFRFPGHVVLAGPNNTGKTTVLQAIASWSLALRRWRELDDFNPGIDEGYVLAPLARHAFTTVPLAFFIFLWTDRVYDPNNPIEIELRHTDGWSVTMEFIADTTEQIYVRPKGDACPDVLRDLDLTTVFIPPMNGIGIEEPVYQPQKIEQLMGIGRPGEVLRNLLHAANSNQRAWGAIQSSVERLFGYTLDDPVTSGAHIFVPYHSVDDPAGMPGLEIASAGSGFQQVLMLLALLNTRWGSVLLLDEPDAHLHVILQDAIYHELRTVAARQRSQLIVATHSESVIDSVEPRELYVMFGQPRRVADTSERSRLISSLRVLSNTDIAQAMVVRGILYVEGYTDINILRSWSIQLGHRAAELLSNEVMLKPVVFQSRSEGVPAAGIKARDHYDALQLVREDLPGLELLDGDAHPEIEESSITGAGLQRLRWRRYEIESYLLHPDALARFVEQNSDPRDVESQVGNMRTYWSDNFPPMIARDPLGDHEFLNVTKARTRLLPPLLMAAGIDDMPYTRYHEIALVMRPQEIHPEVTEKLDGICRAFGVEP